MPELKKLKYRVKKDRYVIFLGSGASIESGGYTSPQIAFNILKQVYGNKTESDLSKRFKKDYNRDVTFEDVLEVFGSGKADHKSMLDDFLTQMKPSKGYSLLAALLKAGIFYPIVLTTNFEPMLEVALKNEEFIKRDIKIRTIISEDVQTEIKPKKNEIIIIKIHGDSAREEPIRTSPQQYTSLPENCEVLIQRLCEKYGFIVVGYRAKDIGIRNAIQRAHPSRNGIFWIAKDPLDEINDKEVFILLEKHHSKENIISNRKFDDIFRELGSDLISEAIRRKHRDDLNEAWTLLDRARSFGSEKDTILESLNNLAAHILKESDLKEVMALREFVQYELDKSGENYRLQQGVQHLESAIDAYAGYMSDTELAEIEYALLGELLNLFFKWRSGTWRTANSFRSINW